MNSYNSPCPSHWVEANGESQVALFQMAVFQVALLQVALLQVAVKRVGFGSVRAFNRSSVKSLAFVETGSCIKRDWLLVQ